MSTNIESGKLDPAIKADLLNDWNNFKFWGALVGNAVSTHYMVVASIAASTFSLFCYVHAITVFESYGIDFLHVANISDIYTVALSTGVISSISLNVILILLIVLTLITVPKAMRRFANGGLRDRIMITAPVSGILVSLALLYSLSIGQKTVPLLSYAESPFLARYRLVTDTTQGNNECIGIMLSTSNNVISWSYSRHQIEIIPKSKLEKIEFVLRAPLTSSLWYPSQKSLSERLEELELVSADQISWTKALKEKCNQIVELSPLLEQEISNLKRKL